MQEISNLALFIIILLVLIPFFVSVHQKLGMEKDIIYSSLRGFTQLMILGYFISFLFSLENLFAVVGYILAMMLIASQNIAKRGIDKKKSFFIIFISIFSTVILCVSVWLTFSIIPLKAQYLIPIAGMFIGSAMVGCGVVLQTMKENIDDDEIKLKRNSIKIAMIPTVDTLKTVGLVQIPGTMTGMILAGGDPYASVKYQIFILFTLLVVASLSSIICCLLNLKFVIKPIKATSEHNEQINKNPENK